MDMQLHVSAHSGSGRFFLVYPAGHEHAGQQEELTEEQYVTTDDAGMAWVYDADDEVVYSCGEISDITIHGWEFYIVWDDHGVLSLEQNPGRPQACSY